MIDNKDYDAVEIINILEGFSDKRLLIDDCNHIDFHRCINGYIRIDEVVIEDKVMFSRLINALVKYAEENLCASIICSCKRDSWIVSYLVKYGFSVEGKDEYNVVLSYVM